MFLKGGVDVIPPMKTAPPLNILITEGNAGKKMIL